MLKQKPMQLLIHYFTPPYKLLTKTSSFNTYAKNGFDDNEQLRTGSFCNKLNQQGYYWLLSNSNASKHGSLNELLISN